MWSKSWSRIVFVSVSAPRVFVTRKRYCAMAFTAATIRIAAAMIQMCSPRNRKPPARSTSRIAKPGRFAAFPPSALSTAARTICGVTMSHSAAIAAETMLMRNQPLLPRRKRQSRARSRRCSIFVFFVCSIMFPLYWKSGDGARIHNIIMVNKQERQILAIWHKVS